MAAHIGIELSVGVCRIVDIDVRRTKTGLESTRVQSFSVLQSGSSELASCLLALRGRSAAVVVWGAPGDHRQVMVTAGRYDAMRMEASRALALAGVETRGAMVDIARAPSAAGHATRRPVVVALANGAAVTAAVRPLRAAGIDIRTVATPATALASLARARRRLARTRAASVPAHGRVGIVEAYVAIEESATCITLLREGTLVAARELSWGFHEGRRGQIRRMEDIAVRFADELGEFLTAVGGSLESIRQVTLCGGAPDLRTVAAVMTERFDIEVEPLDEPFGIDGTLDASTRERCADMWMAWAAAADQPAPLSLLHARQRQAAHGRFARAAIAAGVMVGVGLGWQAAHSPLLRAEPLALRQTVHPHSSETQRDLTVPSRPLDRQP
jgi:hypothetical protein